MFERIANANKARYGELAAGTLLPKIQNMGKLYEANVTATAAYKDWMYDLWEKGKGSDEASMQMLKILLESSELSQKLLSAFFYFDPQTEETMLMRPPEFIGTFLDKIRKMIQDPDRDNQEAFKTLIEAFDQLNEERTHIVNNQGKVLQDFATKIEQFKPGEENSLQVQQDVMDMIGKMNKGNLFDAVTGKSMFMQQAEGDAVTQDTDSVTGSSFGSNELLRVESLVTPEKGGKDIPNEAFVAKTEEPPKPRETIGRVTVPPGHYPEPQVPTNKTKDGRSLLEMYWAHQDKVRELWGQGKSEKEAADMGYKNLSFDEFKAEQEKLG